VSLEQFGNEVEFGQCALAIRDRYRTLAVLLRFVIDSNVDYRLKQDAMQFLIVHTHADPDTGDLWFEGEETGPYAAPADSFISHILGEDVDARRVHIIFLTCRANNWTESINSLIRVSQRYVLILLIHHFMLITTGLLQERCRVSSHLHAA
jgi:hypothetical protein